jgi:drug/metabolite transporter (DMT)-like permease
MITQTIPILGALALACGTVLERYILKKKKLGIRLYQTVSFFAISLIIIPFLFFFWKMDAGAYKLKNILIFLSVIASSITANLFIFYSLKWEKVTNLQPARILEPMFTILLALLFGLFIDGFSDPNPKILIPAIIASVALIFPFISKERICINKYFVAAIFGSFFFGLELILSNLILNFYSPITFYFLRCLSIFIISFSVFHSDTKAMDKKSLLLTFLTAAVWVAYRVSIYFGYQNYGVIFTTLIIMLGPIFIYILANRLLKEKLNWKNIISSVIIIGCVLYATIF